MIRSGDVVDEPDASDDDVRPSPRVERHESHLDRGVGLARRALPTATAIVLLSAIAAHRYLGLTNADALLPSLMSTQQWTVYYWGQDRLANIVPLLAIPIRNVEWNFEIQSLVIASAFFGLGAVFVSFHAWARGARPRPLEHAIATAFTGLAVMVPMHTIAGYRFIIEQLYFVSVVGWVASVWLWNRRRRYVAAAAALQLTTMLNPSLLLASPLVWLLDADAAGRIRRSAGFAATALGAFVVNGLISRWFATGDDPDLPYNEFRLDHLREGLRLTTGNIAGSMRDNLTVVVTVASIVVLAAAVRHLAPRAALTYVAVPAFAGAWLLAFSTNGWVEMNLHEFRYFYPLYVALMLLVAGAVTEIVLLTRRWRPTFEQTSGRARAVVAIEMGAVILSLALAGAVFHRTDVPTLDATEAPVAAAREYDARLVAGGYWTTWPTVVAGRAQGLDLLGVSYRSDPILDEIRGELNGAADDGDSVTVVCSGVGAEDCVGLVNERSEQTWMFTEQLLEWPLVIRISPAP